MSSSGGDRAGRRDSDEVQGKAANAAAKVGRRGFLAAGGGLAGTALLAASGGSAGPASAATLKAAVAGSSKGTAVAAGRNKYYWVSENIADPFYNLGEKGMNAAADLFGFKAQLVGPAAVSTASMVSAMQTVINQPDTAGILSYFQSPSSAGPLYSAALKLGIPIIDAAGQWGEPRQCLIYWEDAATPTAAAELIIGQLHSKGRVGYISNLLTAELTQEADIFESLVKKAGMTFVGRTNYNGSQSDALSRYTAFVKANNPDAMWFGDGSGGAIATALSAVSSQCKLVLRGFDPAGLDAIKSGKVIGSVDRDEFQEEFWGFVMLYLLANHDYVPPQEINLPIFTVTTANVGQFLKSPLGASRAWQ